MAVVFYTLTILEHDLGNCGGLCFGIPTSRSAQPEDKGDDTELPALFDNDAVEAAVGEALFRGLVDEAAACVLS